MQSENHLVADLARVLTGAVGTLAGAGREARDGLRARVRDYVEGLDLVGRDEFEAVKAMAAAARDENEALRARVDALEARLGGAA